MGYMPWPRDEGESPLFDVSVADDGAYCVDLPHQCDEWEVVYQSDPVAAVADMGHFIAEADGALRRLRLLTGRDAPATVRVRLDDLTEVVKDGGTMLGDRAVGPLDAETAARYERLWDIIEAGRDR